MRARPVLTLMAAAALSFFLPTAAVAGPAQTTVQALVALFASWNGDAIDRRLSDAAARRIDYSGMAERAVGEKEWGKLTAAQRSQFVSTFRRLVEERYYGRWHKLFSRGRLSVGQESRAGSDTLVRSALSVGKKTDTVVWRLHPVAGELKVLSLSVGDKDLLARLEQRFQKRLSRDGFDGLLAWLKDRLRSGSWDEDSETSAARSSTLL